MKYLKIRILSGVLLAGLLVTGCFDEPTKVYDGPPVVEFAQYDQPFTTGDNSNYTSNVIFDADTDSGSEDLALLLQLISEQFDSDAHIGFQVVDEQVDSDGEVVEETTAVEGTHYTINTSNNEAVIPANSSTGNIELSVHADDIEQGDSYQLILMLTETDQLSPAENYKYYRIVVGKATP